MTENYLYTEEQIIFIGNQLKELKGKTILDDNNELFLIKDYDIKSELTLNWNGFFKPKKEILMFYIDFITLSGTDGDYVHINNSMCTVTGLNCLQMYHKNYLELESKLNEFALKHNIHLNFGGLQVTPNDP